MREYTIERGTALTPETIADIIRAFEQHDLPKLEKYNRYYEGVQAITAKASEDPSKPCNRIVANYCYNIAKNYSGYMTGVPISYASQQKDFEQVQDILKYNDSKTADAQFLLNALKYGVAYEILYLDETAHTRFAVLDSRQVIPLYANDLTGDLLAAIRYYPVQTWDGDVITRYNVDVYTDREIAHYITADRLTGMECIDTDAHYFGQVPINPFWLNDDGVAIYDRIMSLQDAYNTLLSSEVDDFEAFCDAYLVLTGVQAEPEDIAAMKKNRVLLLDDDSAASYLTKSTTDTQIENMLRNINDQIHKVSNSPDFNDEKLLAQSGIAMRYKLLGFENNAGDIEAHMRKALQRRIELICTILNLTGADAVWRDIDIVFTRNLPVNVVESAQIVNSLRGIVSDKTLLAQLPFVEDPGKELEQLEAETGRKAEVFAFRTGVMENDE